MLNDFPALLGIVAYVVEFVAFVVLAVKRSVGATRAHKSINKKIDLYLFTCRPAFPLVKNGALIVSVTLQAFLEIRKYVPIAIKENSKKIII